MVFFDDDQTYESTSSMKAKSMLGACTLVLGLLLILVAVYLELNSKQVEQQVPMCTDTDPCYNIFVLQWKPELCQNCTAQSCLDDATPNLTIHGIWQNFYDGRWALYCPSDVMCAFEDIEHIEHELCEVWPTLMENKTNLGFWQHEWKKHGTCWQRVVNVSQYFETALKWYAEDDIERILSAAGIHPSNEKLYELETISQALQTGVGARVVPRCWKPKKNKIQEFFMCRDWSGESKIDCPAAIISECEENVLLSEQITPQLMQMAMPDVCVTM